MSGAPNGGCDRSGMALGLGSLGLGALGVAAGTGFSTTASRAPNRTGGAIDLAIDWRRLLSGNISAGGASAGAAVGGPADVEGRRASDGRLVFGGRLAAEVDGRGAHVILGLAIGVAGVEWEAIMDLQSWWDMTNTSGNFGSRSPTGGSRGRVVGTEAAREWLGTLALFGRLPWCDGGCQAMWTGERPSSSTGIGGMAMGAASLMAVPGGTVGAGSAKGAGAGWDAAGHAPVARSLVFSER